MPETQTAKTELQQVIGSISDLPTPPMVLQQINKVINDPNTSAFDIAAILAEDPAMSFKVLKLTNSAYYGFAKEVTSVKQAVIVMGINAVRSMVLSTAVLDMFKGNEKNLQFHDQFWRHSLATASCARLLARRVPGGNAAGAEHAFSVGLLHDIGKLVMNCYLPNDFHAAQQFAEEHQLTPHRAEEEILGYTHAELGGLLAKNWKLPPLICSAIYYHHCPKDSENDIFAYVTHFADYLSNLTFDPPGDLQRTESLLVRETFDVLDISQDELQPLKEALIEEYVKSETFMQIATAL
ncbi:MAG: HDOD domain-containing protein [candidate division Zixibacteria bacterium]|nr:HDOD domain-containing protein [candidate division Zixibacteria bacterium]MBU1471369.1 HDOD domain-containing protein [candidate division Zixibacteria bacterium]MBU2625486.1 HDOD domain-containing protein [candidate division Zixibacteria bacterium]